MSSAYKAQSIGFKYNANPDDPDYYNQLQQMKMKPSASVMKFNQTIQMQKIMHLALSKS